MMVTVTNLKKKKRTHNNVSKKNKTVFGRCIHLPVLARQDSDETTKPKHNPTPTENTRNVRTVLPIIIVCFFPTEEGMQAKNPGNSRG